MMKEGMTTHVYDKDPRDGWAKLVLLTGQLRSDSKKTTDHVISVLSETEIKVGDLLLARFNPIYGVNEIIEFKEKASGDYSNHKRDTPMWYKLKVKVVDVFKAAELDPATFTNMAQAEKDRLKKEKEKKEEKAKEKKSNFRKKRR